MGFIDDLLDPIAVPRLVQVRQLFDRTNITNTFAQQLRDKISANSGYQSIAPGMNIAVAVGSRGIANLAPLVKTTIEMLKKAGAAPFIVPAMGSHGGSTPDGQRGVLAGMGVTEEYVGAPIRATMQTVSLGATPEGVPAVMDLYASEADGIVILNRIKPHVGFDGPYESGLMKMITIGLGKQQGADNCHKRGFGMMAINVPAIARICLAKKNFLFAVGVLENAYHQTHSLVVLNKEEIEPSEPSLLLQAKALAPKIRFKQLDVLIMDELGKDISGTGFDTSVVGRYHTPYKTGGPTISKMAILDLTDVSHGNANGPGLADFTTKRLQDKFIPEQTYPNALTSTVSLTVKMPMALKNDRQAIQAAIKTCNVPEVKRVRLVRIKNTISLDTIEVSENLIDEVKSNPNLELLYSPYDWAFDHNGNLF